jgi:uncharacterized protein
MKAGPFSTSDERVLRAFLASPLRPEGTMTYAAFRGYLFGLSGGPAMVQPSAWMPGVFGDEDAGYADLDEARAVIGVMMNAYNHTNAMISGDLRLTPAAVGLDSTSDDALLEWSAGFTRGYEHVDEEWDRALDGLDEEARDAFSAALVALSIWADRDAYLQDVESADRKAFLEDLRRAIPSALARYATLGLELFRQALARGRIPIRRAPEVGRNDPCPCGSGKKFKKCCLN